MDNQPLNQTQMPQMPQGMNGVVTPVHEKHTGRTIFVALLIVVLAAFLGYWYFTAPNAVPEVTQMPTQQTAPQVTQNNEDLMANVNASEDELNGLYFEGTADGM